MRRIELARGVLFLRVMHAAPGLGTELRVDLQTGAPRSPAWLGSTLAALGVVFGDIGTSPLYAFKECFAGPHGAAPTHANVLGVLSLILWAVTLVVTLKYLCFVMRADNHGEGGIFALLALIPEVSGPRHRLGVYAVLGIVGAALLYGDGVITPAISVLSAVEGLELAQPKLAPLVVPITCSILLGLFVLQRRGTKRIGRLFGPVMLLWFVTLAALGSYHIARYPAVLAALSPTYALHFFASHGLHGALILGAVVLAVTGGEALYADLGHFGIKPIRTAWLALAMPALMLAYLGQGALVLASPSAADDPFFAMVPEGVARYALVLLASCATVIASQALISGVFSLTEQAVKLGFLPRLTIRHTAAESEGQVYVPFVNGMLACACIALVLFFGSSQRLASAYGIAVSGTMAITSLVFYHVVRTRFGWSRALAVPVLTLFLALDVPFVAANAVKIMDGGYLPVGLGALFVAVMLVWKSGQRLLDEALAEDTESLDVFCAEAKERLRMRVPGVAVFVTRDARLTPCAMLRQVASVPVLQERVYVVDYRIAHVPFVPDEDRVQVTCLPNGFVRVHATGGFMQRVSMPELVAQAARSCGDELDAASTTYYLQRETLLAGRGGKMGRLRESLFALLMRNSPSREAVFHIPPHQVTEIGTQLDL